jgi:hypothetical protein
MPCRAATTCLQAMLLISSAMALATTGCGPSAEEQQRAKTQEDFRDSFVRREVDGKPTQEVSHPKRVVVAQGRSPVVFQLREPAMVHVMDLTAGTEIVALDGRRDQWVSVNEDTGVLVGTQHVAPGPLSGGHEFGILLDVGGSGESFQSNVTTDPVAPPRLAPYQPAQPQQAPKAPAPVFQPTTQPTPVGDGSRSNS